MKKTSTLFYTKKTLIFIVFISFGVFSCTKEEHIETETLEHDQRIIGEWVEHSGRKCEFSTNGMFYDIDVFNRARVRPFHTKCDSLFIANENNDPFKSEFNIEGDTLTLRYNNGLFSLIYHR